VSSLPAKPAQSINVESQTDDHSHSRNRNFPFDQVHYTASITNSALYVDKARYGLNSKIAPAENWDRLNSFINTKKALKKLYMFYFETFRIIPNPSSVTEECDLIKQNCNQEKLFVLSAHLSQYSA